MQNRLVSIAFVLLAATVLTGCPRPTRRTLTPDVPTSGNTAARARFEQARARFLRDGVDVSADLQALAQDFPQDPIAPYALLYAGISSVQNQEYQDALEPLDALVRTSHGPDVPEVHEGLRRRGRLYLGIAQASLGRHAAALGLLEGGDEAVETPEERTLWLAAMAESVSRSSRALESLPLYDRWYASATAAEQSYIVDRLRAVVAAADAAVARQAYQALPRRDTPSAAILGLRVAGDLGRQGHSGQARQVRKEIAAARRALGLGGPAGAAAARGNPALVGAILPLTGRRAQAGDLAMRGLALASGTFSLAQGSDMEPFQVTVRDTTSTVDGSAAAVTAVAEDGAIAVIGPIDGDAVDAAVTQAHALGLPLISLNPRSGDRSRQSSPLVFHIMQSAENRAAALARYAYRQGVRSFAMLFPASGYGRAVSAAFRAEVERLGGTITGEASYSAGATAFTDVIAKLGTKAQAVFVPELAQRLELVAPALAAAGLVATPLAQHKGRAPRGARRIVLLSTAEFIAPDYLRGSGRYSEGAVLAPGFYADRGDARIADFVERYEIAYGRLPTALDAYAYDAALLVRQGVDTGAQSRVELGDIMAAAEVEGLTGRVMFDSHRRRADDGLLFTVVREGSDYAIRAMRN